LLADTHASAVAETLASAAVCADATIVTVDAAASTTAAAVNRETRGTMSTLLPGHPCPHNRT
jgi:hypothetical protein